MPRPRSRVLLTSMLALSVMLASRSTVLHAQQISVSGDVGGLVVRYAIAGAEPDPASDASTTYSVTTSLPNQRIVARLDAPLPDGVKLTLHLVAPAGATSRGDVTLSTFDQEVVGPIPAPGTYAGLQIVYTLEATVKAGPVPTIMRGTTLSVIDGP